MAKVVACEARGSLAPSRIFLTFFLLGPAFAAALQLLLLNVMLLVLFLLDIQRHPVPPGGGWFVALLFGGMELSGAVEAILIYLLGLPASLIVAASATLSYLAVKRVSVVAVVAAVAAANLLEGILAPGAYLDYLAWHGVRGPWVPEVPDEQGTDATGAGVIFAVFLLHLLPALMCWWLLRRRRQH
jgi:hypothetical protein